MLLVLFTMYCVSPPRSPLLLYPYICSTLVPTYKLTQMNLRPSFVPSTTATQKMTNRSLGLVVSKLNLVGLRAIRRTLVAKLILGRFVSATKYMRMLFPHIYYISLGHTLTLNVARDRVIVILLNFINLYRLIYVLLRLATPTLAWIRIRRTLIFAQRWYWTVVIFLRESPCLFA